jgi:hypothetical protein
MFVSSEYAYAAIVSSELREDPVAHCTSDLTVVREALLACLASSDGEVTGELSP